MALLICSLQSAPVMHLFNARFKEHEGDIIGAQAALLHCDGESDSNFVENVVMKANMEKRLVLQLCHQYSIQKKYWLHVFSKFKSHLLIFPKFREILKQLLIYMKKHWQWLYRRKSRILFLFYMFTFLDLNTWWVNLLFKN